MIQYKRERIGEMSYSFRGLICLVLLGSLRHSHFCLIYFERDETWYYVIYDVINDVIDPSFQHMYTSKWF